MSICLTTSCTRETANPSNTICSSHIQRALYQLDRIPDMWHNIQGTQPLLPQRAEHERLHPRKPGSAPPVNLTILAIRDIRTNWTRPGDLLNPQVALGEITAWIHQTQKTKPKRFYEYSIDDSCRIITASIHLDWSTQQAEAGRMCDTIDLSYNQLISLQHQTHQPAQTTQCPTCATPITPHSSGAQCACTTYTPLALVRALTTQPSQP